MIWNLEAELKRAGFVWHSGKGSHRIYKHPNGALIPISGGGGADARPYQEKAVAEALRKVRK